MFGKNETRMETGTETGMGMGIGIGGALSSCGGGKGSKGGKRAPAGQVGGFLSSVFCPLSSVL
jgi:hypothetical protein